MSNTEEKGNMYDSAIKHRKDRLNDGVDWAARLAAFLQTLPGTHGKVSITNLKTPSAGGSAGTVLFTAEFEDGNGRCVRDMVLRSQASGGLFHTYDLPGQYKILEALSMRGLPVPKVVGIDAEGQILGVPGFIMERIEGEVPPPSYYQNGVFYEAPPQQRRQMIHDVIGALARIHSVDWRSAGLAFLERRGAGKTAVERDLDWHRNAMRWGNPAFEAELAPIFEWLLAQQPAEADNCLNHGDTMLGNYLFHHSRLSGVLDWELAFLGAPENDITHQVFAHQVLGLNQEPLEGFPTEQEWKTEYERVSGRRLVHWDYYFVISALKIYIDMILVFRNAPPELVPVRDNVLQYVSQNLRQRWEKAKAPSPGNR